MNSQIRTIKQILEHHNTFDLDDDQAEKALVDYFIELIGEDETSDDEVENDLYFATRNGLRAEFRAKLGGQE